MLIVKYQHNFAQTTDMHGRPQGGAISLAFFIADSRYLDIEKSAQMFVSTTLYRCCLNS